MIGRLLCMAGWHSARWRLLPTPDRLEVVCPRCNLLLERVSLPRPKPLRSHPDSAVPSPADPPPSVQGIASARPERDPGTS